MRIKTRWAGAAALAGLALLPGAAAAAERPEVQTGRATGVGQSTVVLHGWVNPRRAETSYFFQYGPTVIYGGLTPATSAGAGNRRVRVSVPVAGLAPATRYDYRLVAQSAEGLARGENARFRTQRQPLGVSLAASDVYVRPEDPVVLSGTLSGTGNAGRQVVLQANPFPFAGFVNVGNAQVTDAAGNFSFTLLGIGISTAYRVIMPQKPEVASPLVGVSTKLKVLTDDKDVTDRDQRRARVSIRGRVAPAAVGAPVIVQKRRGDGPWHAVARRKVYKGGGTWSRWGANFRQKRGGEYRVKVESSGAHATDTGRTFRVVINR